jgi:hypothetical protein
MSLDDVRYRLRVVSFKAQGDFSIPAKKEKLHDLVYIMTRLNSFESYQWFAERYKKIGRKWVRKREGTK